MKQLFACILLMLFYSKIYSQDDIDILLQFSGQSITIRKGGENSPMWYSEKHDRILNDKNEFSDYPDSYYHIVKPTITIFSSKMFKTDTKEQTHIRVDYFFQKRINGKSEIKEIERWQKSYYPSIQKVVNAEDTRETDGKFTLTMDDKSVWIIEIEKDGSNSIFYVTQGENSYLNYALMFPYCKKEIENGVKL